MWEDYKIEDTTIVNSNNSVSELSYKGIIKIFINKLLKDIKFLENKI